MSARAAGLLAGYLADRLLGDPRRGHPVAGLGRLAAALEGRVYADSRARGAVYTGLIVGGSAAVGVAAERACRGRPIAKGVATAAVTWVVLGGRSLEREALAAQKALARAEHGEAPELEDARRQVGRIVGRDTGALHTDGIARATVETLAENTSDAVVAPLVWGALAGVPGLLAYRAANTLDAMVGYRSERYARFGWASARLDDLLNLPGARLTGLLVMAAAPPRAPAAWATWRADARSHPSPNAGIPEATVAGTLGVRLGGTNHYPGGVVEHRAVLGSGRPPTADDITAAVRITRRVGLVAALVCASLAEVVARAGTVPDH
ncbi:cobalamin biosynthesis protein [Marihabitans asiaticum]|uniref:Cobalamin biosynthesis protein CobD n=1 Tax=Marihabitans asiaticum TaxID=415218 RepID=A0A560WG80_9MICO|nr:cobalamin biosynthesis protein [Marihabitans asiaticum]TWD16692.1 adenosylcobinamide-phosphate synthase [Marihabitans asiaticum]